MKKLSLALLAVSIIAIAFSQDHKVQMFGKIIDENQKPIAKVTIELRDTEFKTETDDAGKYFVMLPAKKGILVYSCKGYKTKKLEFTGTAQANDLILEAEKKAK